VHAWAWWAGRHAQVGGHAWAGCEIDPTLWLNMQVRAGMYGCVGMHRQEGMHGQVGMHG